MAAAEAAVDVVACDEKSDEDGRNSPDSSSEPVATTSSMPDDYVYQAPSGVDIFKWHQGRIHDSEVKVWTGTKRLEPNGTAEEVELVESLRKSRADMLNRVGSFRPIDVLQALWDEEGKRVVVTKHKGTYLKFMGAKVGDRTVLHPHEALFLLEANQLLLMRDGVPVSISEGYELLLKDGDDYDRYLVYSHILRAGYIVVPHRKQVSRETSKPAETEAKEVKGNPHESDDDVVCLDDSDDSDISVVEVIPAKFPKLDPSITITPATSPKRNLFPDKRRSRGGDLTFPQYVAGQPLVLKRPPRHLLPRNVYPSREWYEVDPTRWCQEEIAVREKRRNRGWYGERSSTNWDQRHSSGRRNPAIPDLRPDLQCQGNGQAWQAPDTSSWHAPNNSAPTAPEQRRDGRTWSNNTDGYGTGQPRGPYQGGDGPWNNAAARQSPYDASHCQPWWHGGGGLGGGGPPQPWNFADTRGAASMERPPIPLPWGPGQPWRTVPPPPLHPLPPPPPLLPGWPSRKPHEGSPHGSGNQYGYFTEAYVSETSQRSQEPRRFGSGSSFFSGPGRPDRPTRPNQASYRRSAHRNDSSPRRNWQRGPHRPSHWRSGARGGPDEEDYPSALPPFSAEATSWSELKSGLAQSERSEALLGGEGSVLWKGSIEPLVTPTQDVSIPGIVSQLAIIQEVDLVNGSRQSNGSTSDSSDPVTPDLDVYLPATSYSKRNPGTPECRVCVVRWEDGPAQLRDLKARQSAVSDGAPLVFAAVDQGQVHLYAFDVMEAPRFFPVP